MFPLVDHAILTMEFDENIFIVLLKNGIVGTGYNLFSCRRYRAPEISVHHRKELSVEWMDKVIGFCMK